MMYGQDNPTFVGDTIYTIPPGEYRRNITQFYPGKYQQTFPPSQPPTTQLQANDSVKDGKKPPKERDSWGKGIEFLLSVCFITHFSINNIFTDKSLILLKQCIAMSVGLGNIWRFPFIALENGGGTYQQSK